MSLNCIQLIIQICYVIIFPTQVEYPTTSDLHNRTNCDSQFMDTFSTNSGVNSVREIALSWVLYLSLKKKKHHAKWTSHQIATPGR